MSEKPVEQNCSTGFLFVYTLYNMKIIRNNIIPVKGFSAMNLFGILFVRNGIQISDTVMNHEKIHSAQIKELLYIPFYIFYLSEWIFRILFSKGNAYRNISFEREAYCNQENLNYLKHRKHYSFIKYL